MSDDDRPTCQSASSRAHSNSRLATHTNAKSDAAGVIVMGSHNSKMDNLECWEAQQERDGALARSSHIGSDAASSRQLAQRSAAQECQGRWDEKENTVSSESATTVRQRSSTSALCTRSDAANKVEGASRRSSAARNFHRSKSLGVVVFEPASSPEIRIKMPSCEDVASRADLLSDVTFLQVRRAGDGSSRSGSQLSVTSSYNFDSCEDVSYEALVSEASVELEGGARSSDEWRSSADDADSSDDDVNNDVASARSLASPQSSSKILTRLVYSNSAETESISGALVAKTLQTGSSSPTQHRQPPSCNGRNNNAAEQETILELSNSRAKSDKLLDFAHDTVPGAAGQDTLVTLAEQCASGSQEAESDRQAEPPSSCECEHADSFCSSDFVTSSSDSVSDSFDSDSVTSSSESNTSSSDMSLRSMPGRTYIPKASSTFTSRVALRTTPSCETKCKPATSTPKAGPCDSNVNTSHKTEAPKEVSQSSADAAAVEQQEVNKCSAKRRRRRRKSGAPARRSVATQFPVKRVDFACQASFPNEKTFVYRYGSTDEDDDDDAEDT